MKTLKKGKKYIRVTPLPKGWHGAEEVAKAASSKNKYQASFKKLKDLLDDGWQYCPKSELRQAALQKEEGRGKNS
jgi:hypothetical protein